MPRPPIHCNQDRTNRKLLDLSATVGEVVRPVVVTAEIVSNSESEKDIPEEAITGQVMTKGINMNTSALITMASLVCNLLGARKRLKYKPMRNTTSATIIYRTPSKYSPDNSDTARGTSIRIASIQHSSPKYFNTGRGLTAYFNVRINCSRQDPTVPLTV